MVDDEVLLLNCGGEILCEGPPAFWKMMLMRPDWPCNNFEILESDSRLTGETFHFHCGCCCTVLVEFSSF